MKIHEKIEYELFKAKNMKVDNKEYLSPENRLKLDERIKVLEWILSDSKDAIGRLFD